MIPAMPGAAAVGFLLMLLAAMAFAARQAQAAAAHLAMGGGGIAVHLHAARAGADCMDRSAAGTADGRARTADAHHAGSVRGPGRHHLVCGQPYSARYA